MFSKTNLYWYMAANLWTNSVSVVDIKFTTFFSGIILFEMCYKPLDTAMERIKILTKLRLKEILFPEDFISKKTEKQQYLIR